MEKLSEECKYCKNGIAVLICDTGDRGTKVVCGECRGTGKVELKESHNPIYDKITDYTEKNKVRGYFNAPQRKTIHEATKDIVVFPDKTHKIIEDLASLIETGESAAEILYKIYVNCLEGKYTE